MTNPLRKPEILNRSLMMSHHESSRNGGIAAIFINQKVSNLVFWDKPKFQGKTHIVIFQLESGRLHDSRKQLKKRNPVSRITNPSCPMYKAIYKGPITPFITGRGPSCPISITIFDFPSFAALLATRLRTTSR